VEGTTQKPIGSQLCVLGDVDGDGVPDWATGGPDYLRVISGATGLMLHELGGAEYTHWDLDGVGDLNGDGLPEILIGSDPVRVLSTGSWSELRTHSGWSDPALVVAGLPDLTGDGVDDYALCNTLQQVGVTVFNGATGAVHMVLPGPVTIENARFGRSICSPGDLNADGVPEILVGAPEKTVFFAPGAAYVFDGASGALFRVHEWGTLSGMHGDEGLGIAATGVGDVDWDGVPDYAVASWREHRLRLFSGATGSVLQLWLLTGEVWDFFAPFDLVAADDVNGDGSLDLVVKVPKEIQDTRRRVDVLSTRPPYEVIDEIRGPSLAFATRLAGGVDFDGDGRGDLLLSDLSFPHSFEDGRVTQFSLSPTGAFARVECDHLPNSTGAEGKIWFAGSQSIADDALALVAWQLPPERFGLFYFGPNETSSPFGEGLRCVGDPLTRMTPLLTSTGGVAQSPFNFGAPATPGTAIQAGVTTRFQFWHRDAGATFNLTDAFRATFVP